MKNFLITLSILLLFGYNLSYAQSPNLCRIGWQLQNPSPATVSMMIGFNNKGEYNWTATNLATKEQSSGKGSYVLNGDKLYMQVSEDNTVIFIINWFSTTKMSLTYNDNKYIYAVIGSYEDHFMQNLLNSQNSGSYYNTTPTTQPKSHTCYTCNGTGSCTVCRGSGYYSMYGYGGTCSACSGTGKCWGCGGARIVNN